MPHAPRPAPTATHPICQLVTTACVQNNNTLQDRPCPDEYQGLGWLGLVLWVKPAAKSLGHHSRPVGMQALGRSPTGIVVVVVVCPRQFVEVTYTAMAM